MGFRSMTIQRWTSGSAALRAPDDGAGAGAVAGTDTGAGAAAGTDTGAAGAAGAGGDWTAGFSEAALDVVKRNDFKTAEASVLAFDETQKMVGGPRDRMVFIPGENATPEDWQQFRARAGRPETAAGYEPAAREGSDEGSDTAIAELAHAMGLDKRQFAQLREAHYGAGDAGRDAFAKEIDAAAARCSAELAARFGDQWTVKEEMTRRAETYLTGGDANLAAALKSAGLKGSATFMERLITIGEAVAGDGKLFGGGGGGGGTPASATAEIERLKGDKAHQDAIMDKAHPGHAAAIELRDRLFKQAYPEG